MTTEIRETHVSTLFLVGDRAYKLKKPVTTGFLDFSTREARERACQREVELNRRLAPDVYLGVSTVLGVDGVPCDHLVVMRRMPEDRRLSSLVKAGEDVRPVLRDLAHRLAAFHTAAATGPDIAAAASPEAVARRWEENLAEMTPFVGPLLGAGAAERVADLARRYVAGREPLLRARLEGGWVRDGHGDLLADDIFWLPDGPRVLDCIEFDDRLRYGDVLADVAFLVMDLERLGHPELGAAFQAWYEEFSGERHPESLAHHYVAYRALVRSKVACLRHEQGDARAAGDARMLHEMARSHLEQAQVVMVLVGGLPGVGKSTLAAGLAANRGWAMLRSDEIRKELVGLPPDRPAPASYREGLYSVEATNRTYAEMLSRTRSLVEAGEPVVLDASWSAARHRQVARRLAAETSTLLVELRCEVDPAVAARRLSERAERVEGSEREDGASDATPEVAAAMSVDADPWPEASAVDTGEDPEAAARQADGLIDEATSAAC